MDYEKTLERLVGSIINTGVLGSSDCQLLVLACDRLGNKDYYYAVRLCDGHLTAARNEKIAEYLTNGSWRVVGNMNNVHEEVLKNYGKV